MCQSNSLRLDCLLFVLHCIPLWVTVYHNFMICKLLFLEFPELLTELKLELEITHAGR